MASLQRISIALPLQNDNTIGTRWRTVGAKGPSAPALVWGSLSVVAGLIANQTVGSSFSHDVRQYLSGTDAATATITIVQVSGDNAASEGWAISSAGAGNNLTHPGSGTGSGFFLLLAASVNGSIASAVLGWSWIAAGGTDSLAPTVPVRLAITPLTNSLQFDWSRAQDPLAGSSTASGVKDYRIRKAGVVVATVPASSPGVSPTSTDATLGSYSPTPSFGYSSANGGQYSITSAGTGTHNTTTEQVRLRGWQVSGNFKFRAKLVQFNSVGGYAYSTAGLMIGSRVQGQPFVYFYHEPITGGSRVQLKRRPTAGTNSGNVAANAVTQLGYLEVTRTGDVWRTEYSADGITWNLNGETTVALPTDVYVDLAVASQVDGQEVTATFEQVSITTTAAETYTLNPATAGSYTISARDISLNESAQSAAVVGTPVAAPVSTGIRFFPGHYVRYDTLVKADNRASIIPAIVAMYNNTKIKDDPYIQGLMVAMTWGALEQGTTEATATYTQGLTDLRTLCDAARAVSKKIMIGFQHVIFGGTGASLDPWFPNYIWTGAANGYGWTVMSNGKITRIWQQRTMDRVIAQINAYMNADNGHGVAFKDDPVIAMVSIDETSVAVANGVDDYSISALTAQFVRYIQATRANAPTTPFRLTGNFLGSNDNTFDLLQVALESKFAVGGPDTIPSQSVQFNRIFSGTPPVPELPNTSQTRAVTDLRGVIPWVSEIQTPSMNGTKGDYSALQLDTFATDGGLITVAKPNPPGGTIQVTVRGMDYSYMVWALKEWEQNSSGPTDSGGIKFSTARLGDGSPSIKAYIDSISGAVANSDCPDAWDGC